MTTQLSQPRVQQGGTVLGSLLVVNSLESAPAILDEANVGAVLPMKWVSGLPSPTSGGRTMVGIWEMRSTSLSLNSAGHVSID